jgi:hypothetical protein
MIYLFIFSVFLTVYPFLDFKKYIGISKFPFRALIEGSEIKISEKAAPQGLEVVTNMIIAKFLCMKLGSTILNIFQTYGDITVFYRLAGGKVTYKGKVVW